MLDVVSYGIDTMDCSISNCVLRDCPTHFFADLKFLGSSHGYDYYDAGDYKIGYDGEYFIFNFKALFFINRTKSFDVSFAIFNLFDSIFLSYDFSDLKLIRLDIYLDYVSPSVSLFSTSDFVGRHKTKTSVFYGTTGEVETSYLFSASKSFVIRRYNKSVEINDNMKAHLYPESYFKNNVIRFEVEYNKSCLKNLESRNLHTVVDYVFKHLGDCMCVEANHLQNLLADEFELFLPSYRAKDSGISNGQRLRDKILDNYLVLLDDYSALNGNLDDFEKYLLDYKERLV